MLDECSGRGVSGYSAPPNFAVIDTAGVLASGGVAYPLTLQFTDAAPYTVRATVGGPAGATAGLNCTICPWAVPSCSRWAEVTLGGPMQTIEVSADYRFALGCSVYIVGRDGTMIIDDLEFEFEPPGGPIAAVPATGPIGVAALVGLLAITAAVLLRRTSAAA